MTAPGLLLDAAERSEVRLGGRCRVVVVDGPAGSGKTTLAVALAEAARARGHEAAVVHMDDLYDGWRGVLVVDRQVRDLLQSLHRTGSAAYRRYDWERGAYAERRTLSTPDVLVLEGVGSADPGSDVLVTLRVWVEAPHDVRVERGLRRDGEHLRERWSVFLRDEGVVHARNRTRERADAVVDGLTGTVQHLRV